jgi:hypothetical protein
MRMPASPKMTSTTTMIYDMVHSVCERTTPRDD